MVSVVSLWFGLASPASAMPVMYQFDGDMLGQFVGPGGDATGALFGVPGNSLSTVAASIQIVVDPDDVPFVENDTPVGQQVTYFDAIRSARIEINGAVFETNRPPVAGTTESRIEVINIIDPSGLDSIILQTASSQLPLLWDSITVPLNQTIGGLFVENAEVHVASLLITTAGIGTGWLSDFALPTESDGFDGITSLGGAIQFGVDLGPGLAPGFHQLNLSSGTVTVSPASVPEPAVTALLIPVLVLAAARARR